VKRRDFITLLGGAAAAWPLAARAQQAARMRRIGVLMGYAESDPEAQTLVQTFHQALRGLGWRDGENLQIEYRWGAGEPAQIQAVARELVASRPDLILANTTPVTRALQRETKTIPIVFVIVSDPVGDGFVSSLARPGGNITGFINYEASMAGKWLEMLKQIAPAATRAALIYNPDVAPGGGSYFRAPFEAAALALGMQPVLRPVRRVEEVEGAVADLRGAPPTAIVTGFDAFLTVHRKILIAAAARDAVPAIYSRRAFAADGGLVSYGPDYMDLFGRAAAYVDRILKGTRPEDLPVQLPTKFEFVINLKTAHALGLEIPPSLLAAADEVIE
jgi:putative tryptophan/tyrosine transport system substrate-binding protein